MRALEKTACSFKRLLKTHYKAMQIKASRHNFLGKPIQDAHFFFFQVTLTINSNQKKQQHHKHPLQHHMNERYCGNKINYAGSFLVMQAGLRNNKFYLSGLILLYLFIIIIIIIIVCYVLCVCVSVVCVYVVFFSSST